MIHREIERAVLDGIVESPHDLASWLIFVDLLKDHNEPRAEVTRQWAKGKRAQVPWARGAELDWRKWIKPVAHVSGSVRVH